jgi:hypothetical protein
MSVTLGGEHLQAPSRLVPGPSVTRVLPATGRRRWSVGKAAP